MTGLIWALCLLLGLLVPVLAEDDDALNGLAADTLTIKVGYFGGPYYEKAVFTLEELWNMDVVYADYTFIDNMPSVVIDHVAGIRLSDLMDAAGIDLNSIQTFYFWTRDKQSDYYTAYSKSALIDTPRYCYYALPDNWDEDEGCGDAYATEAGDPVPTVIALADDWNRSIAGASFGSDYLHLNTNTRFRLIFGQTNAYERTANRSAKWIHEIVVELGGAPSLTLDATALEGAVGSLLRTELGVSADSAILAQEPVRWSSADAQVATVDEAGNITIVGEGSTVITASFAGVSASLTVTGVPGQGETPAPGSAAQAGEAAPAQRPGKPLQQAQPETSAAENHESVQPGRYFELLRPERLTEDQQGGVQNWRREEMSDTASALGNIPSENAAKSVGIGLAALLLLSGALYAGAFYLDIKRGREHESE